MNLSLDWSKIDLVVFDVDGTLYDQKRLRLSMLRMLLSHTWHTRSLSTLRVLRTFRRIREALGNSDSDSDDFMQRQYTETAAQHALKVEQVQAVSTEWLEQRPLSLLAGCRYPHLSDLFTGLHAAGKKIAVFSDYPAKDKLRALALSACPVVCATDSDVARLKPNPLGLLRILQITGVKPGRALMIGDRFDRDAAAAKRAGVRALILSPKPHPEFETFTAYNDAVFRPFLSSPAMPSIA